MSLFEPTRDAALARLSAVDPAAYARTRNALHGAVTRLSPYLTHGVLSLREVYETVNARHRLDAQHKFVFELGWRAYWHHAWSHLGDGIHQSIHPGLLPDAAYLPEMPADILEARTGIAAIDLAVRELYASGYVHNHARMWLASYIVHLRKVHWHAGAQWMLGHLLDGDLASNHLSWQWVAGTFSRKPYLFNAENVAKYAPAPWHSPGTAIDTTYEALDAVARGDRTMDTRFDGRRAERGVQQPRLYASPPGNSRNVDATDTTAQPCWQPPGATDMRITGHDVWLYHPWSLHTPPDALPPDAIRIAVRFDTDHTAWSERRWDFVTRGLQTQTGHLWWGSADQIAHSLQHARSVHWEPNPHIDPALAQLQLLLRGRNPLQTAGPRPPKDLFEPVDRHCRSFSDWWKRTRIA